MKITPKPCPKCGHPLTCGCQRRGDGCTYCTPRPQPEPPHAA